MQKVMQKGVTDSVSEVKKSCLDMEQSEEEKRARMEEIYRLEAQQWIEAELLPVEEFRREYMETLRKKRAQMSEQNK